MDRRGFLNMIYTYDLVEKNMDLSTCIERHSGDETIVYKTVEGADILLSIYFPHDYEKGNQYPAFFFIHGGGWESHKIFADQEKWSGDHLGYLARYYADKGYVGISINYRLLQELGQKDNYRISDLYADCVDAVNYVLDRAEHYRIDMENAYLLGESAGGHLAGLVATKYERKGFAFKRAFLVNAITELVDDEVWSMRATKETAKELSPLYNISEGICPVTLIHGAKDHVVNPKHSELFYQRMQTLHRECDLHWIADTDHAFLLAEYTSNQNACRIGIEIIDSYLEERQDEF